MLASLTIVVKDAVSGLLSTTSVVRRPARAVSELSSSLAPITGCSSRRAVIVGRDCREFLDTVYM